MSKRAVLVISIVGVVGTIFLLWLLNQPNQYDYLQKSFGDPTGEDVVLRWSLLIECAFWFILLLGCALLATPKIKTSVWESWKAMVSYGIIGTIIISLFLRHPGRFIYSQAMPFAPDGFTSSVVLFQSLLILIVSFWIVLLVWYVGVREKWKPMMLGSTLSIVGIIGTVFLLWLLNRPDQYYFLVDSFGANNSDFAARWELLILLVFWFVLLLLYTRINRKEPWKSGRTIIVYGVIGTIIVLLFLRLPSKYTIGDFGHYGPNDAYAIITRFQWLLIIAVSFWVALLLSKRPLLLVIFGVIGMICLLWFLNQTYQYYSLAYAYPVGWYEQGIAVRWELLIVVSFWLSLLLLYTLLGKLHV